MTYNEEDTNSNQTSELFCSSNSSVEINNSNTLIYESSSRYNDETIVSHNLWTLKLKPPTYDDALNFIDKFKHINYSKQSQLKYNNVLENIRKNLLSLSFHIGNDVNFFASESNIILEPLKKPPSYEMAFKWLESRCSKNKFKKKNIQSNKRKGLLTPQSITKSLQLNKINHSTPNSSQSKFYSSPYTPKIKENKSLKSKRKLSALFLDSLHVRCHFIFIHV